MAANANNIVDVLEEEALEQLKEVRAYRVHAGTDQERFRRAKFALAVVGNYVRLRATVANERTNELVAQRMTAVIDAPPDPKRLTE